MVQIVDEETAFHEFELRYRREYGVLISSQARAVLGEDAEAELPLFGSGLVCSADGMFWSGAG